MARTPNWSAPPSTIPQLCLLQHLISECPKASVAHAGSGTNMNSMLQACLRDLAPELPEILKELIPSPRKSTLNGSQVLSELIQGKVTPVRAAEKGRCRWDSRLPLPQIEFVGMALAYPLQVHTEQQKSGHSNPEICQELLKPLSQAPHQARSHATALPRTPAEPSQALGSPNGSAQGANQHT